MSIRLPSSVRDVHQLLHGVLRASVPALSEKAASIILHHAVDIQHELEHYGITWKREPDLMTAAIFLDVLPESWVMKDALLLVLPPTVVALVERVASLPPPFIQTEPDWAVSMNQLRAPLLCGNAEALDVLLLLIVRRVARVHRYWKRRDARLFAHYGQYQEFDRVMRGLCELVPPEWRYRKEVAAMLDEHIALFNTWE